MQQRFPKEILVFQGHDTSKENTVRKPIIAADQRLHEGKAVYEPYDRWPLSLSFSQLHVYTMTISHVNINFSDWLC